MPNIVFGSKPINAWLSLQWFGIPTLLIHPLEQPPYNSKAASCPRDLGIFISSLRRGRTNTAEISRPPLPPLHHPPVEIKPKLEGKRQQRGKLRMVPPNTSVAVPLPARCPSGVADGLLVFSVTFFLYVITAKFLHVSSCHRVCFIPVIPLVLPLFWSRSQN